MRSSHIKSALKPGGRLVLLDPISEKLLESSRRTQEKDHQLAMHFAELDLEKAGFEAQVRPRSGLALRHGVTVLNSPGTIDSDYRGEVGVVLVNLGREAFTLRRGERIAQLVLQRVERVEFEEVEELAASDRGEGGFGSSGVE